MKTKVVIDLAELLFHNCIIQRVLVITDLSIIDTWAGVEGELKLHSSCSHWVVLTGTKQERVRRLQPFYHGTLLNWFLINVDGVRVIEKELRDLFDMVIIDESTSIKNANASRTKKIIKLFGTVPYKIIMSGNPIPQGPEEIYAQYKFIEPGLFGGSQKRFRERFFNLDFFGKVVKPDEDDLNNPGTFLPNCEKYYNELFHRIAFVKRKDECLDLPPKVYEREHVEMSKEQAEIYEAMRKDALVSYEDKHCAATVILTKMLRLSQIAGGTLPLMPLDNKRKEMLRIHPNPKLERLVEIIKGLPETEQVVVWARFVEEIVMIDECLQRDGISCGKFYGDTSVVDRIQLRKDFKDKHIRVFIGNAETGGKGLNDLVGATTVIYYSNDFSAEARQQSEDRNHRKGTVKVTYIDLITKGTIDNAVLSSLRKRQDFSRAVLNRTVSI